MVKLQKRYPFYVSCCCSFYNTVHFKRFKFLGFLKKDSANGSIMTVVRVETPDYTLVTCFEMNCIMG